MKEKGLRDSDPFEELVIDSIVIDVDEDLEFADLIAQVSRSLAHKSGHAQATFVAGFTEGTHTGATPVAKGVALPHMRLEGIQHPHLVLVRLSKELRIMAGNVFGEESLSEAVHAVFFLVSSENDASQHLRILAQLATRIDQDDSIEKWMSAKSELQLREIFLRDDRYISIHLESDRPSWEWSGRELSSIGLPNRCLVAAIRRHGKILVPRGSTRLLAGDRLLIFGEPDVIPELYAVHEPE
ncbi:MAG: APA family basic amino acid/polyamine antiporter [Candidatus Paceibacteria bacterium]